jgi:tetratricopeptide (TPR) repeat protein
VPAAEISAALNGADNLVTPLNVLPTLALGAAGRDLGYPVDVRQEAVSLPGTATFTLFERNIASTPLTDGELTCSPLLALLKTLSSAMEIGCTYVEWAESTKFLPPAAWSVRGHAHERVMQDRSSMIAALRHLAATRTADAAETARCAEAEISRREAVHEPHPEGHLQRGLALEACQRYLDALAALRTARSLYQDESVWQAELRRDPAVSEWLRQAHYHYGRLQLEHGDDLNEAVAALRAAMRQDSDDPRVLRTLAQAIRALVERETLMEAAQLLIRYVNSGSPLGITQEMAEFLNQRRRE